MESPKRGCDLGTCVVKRWRSKTHCDYLLRSRGFPRGQGSRSGPLRSENAAFCVCVLKPAKVVTPCLLTPCLNVPNLIYLFSICPSLRSHISAS